MISIANESYKLGYMDGINNDPIALEDRQDDIYDIIDRKISIVEGKKRPTLWSDKRKMLEWERAILGDS